MSYIRSTSNPESLYIWGDGDNAFIMMGFIDIGTIPIKTLNGLIKKYWKGKCEDCKYDGAEIKEINDQGNFKMELSYNGWKFNMWEVTWDYIVNTNKHRK